MPGSDPLDKQQQEKLAALRAAVAVGIDQLDRGEGLDGEHVFAELLDEETRRELPADME